MIIKKKLYKNIPNLITMVRIFCTFLVLFTSPLTWSFYLLYIICGISDILDGFLARRLHMASELGATLDSIADFLFIGIVMLRIVTIISFKTWQILWIIGIATIRLSAVCIAAIRFRTFTLLHTYLNKLTGFMLFVFPLCMDILSFGVLIIILCSIATLSSIEELFLDCTMTHIDRNIKGILTRFL